MNIIYFIMNIVMSMSIVCQLPMTVCCCDCLDAVFLPYGNQTVQLTLFVSNIIIIIGEQTVWDIHRLIIAL